MHSEKCVYSLLITNQWEDVMICFDIAGASNQDTAVSCHGVLNDMEIVARPIRDVEPPHRDLGHEDRVVDREAKVLPAECHRCRPARGCLLPWFLAHLLGMTFATAVFARQPAIWPSRRQGDQGE